VYEGGEGRSRSLRPSSGLANDGDL
jgi:hypothetical protein